MGTILIIVILILLFGGGGGYYGYNRYGGAGLGGVLGTLLLILIVLWLLGFIGGGGVAVPRARWRIKAKKTSPPKRSHLGEQRWRQPRILFWSLGRDAKSSATLIS